MKFLVKRQLMVKRTLFFVGLFLTFIMIFVDYSKEVAKANELDLKLSTIEADVQAQKKEADVKIVEVKKVATEQKEQLKDANDKIEKTKSKVNELTEATDNVVATCEDTKKQLKETKEVLEDIKSECASADEKHLTMAEETVKTKFKAKRKIQESEALLETVSISHDEVSEKHEAVKEEVKELEEKTEKDIPDTQELINTVQSDCETAYQEYTELEMKVQDFEETLNGLREKMDFQISGGMDVSKPLGLTEEEVRLLLQITGLIQNESVVEVLPKVLVETVKEYPVNEIFFLGVMCTETGYCTSNLAVYKNNFGGMMYRGKGMSFSSVEEGLSRAIKCLHDNLKGSNTIHEVNSTYCQSAPDGMYSWSTQVLSIMKRFQEATNSSF